MDIILASASPRRRELLARSGVNFRVIASDADETLSDDLKSDPHKAALELAQRKAATVAQEILGTSPKDARFIVIGADTMVIFDGQIFGKPQDVQEARGMLRTLSGNTHEVTTGVSVWTIVADAAGNVDVGRNDFFETSFVTFKQLDDEAIDEYLRVGESHDKAGAYAIQGQGARLVERWEGDFDNIVGLPVDALLDAFPDMAK